MASIEKVWEKLEDIVYQIILSKKGQDLFTDDEILEETLDKLYGKEKSILFLAEKVVYYVLNSPDNNLVIRKGPCEYKFNKKAFNSNFSSKGAPT